ncbi:2-polyprenyl-6-methoxyphenol hydroxylase [Streptomyces sp. WMMB 714]|uniref:FAD-dependent monooxygenase n=1 Tax=Streptomyces sp. WMMB 714 TaxID=1286822 RepID=UPI0005F86769|nr:FAD-dependent monooxygenase [Streptomyces sp. WMMB 714]SCK55784.1 2-polyprenyl-6-methoxyphenol hydroxylase [Streptomyces sp. WMMB 714]
MARSSAQVPGDGTSRAADVIVVGAGPAGLLTAGDLAAAGHRVTVVEKRDAGISNLTRSLVVHARTLEQLDARGVGDELAGLGAHAERLGVFRRAVLDPTTLPSRYPYILVVGQSEVERLLERRAREAGATFLYGTEVTGLRQDGTGVEVDVAVWAAGGAQDEPDGSDGSGSGSVAPAGGAAAAPAVTTGTLRASYLVGCDGVRSSVRSALGLPFPGRSVIRSIVLADVRLAEPPSEPFMFNAVDDAFALVADFGDGWYRVGGWNRKRQLPDSEPADLGEVRDFTRRALGSDFGMYGPRWVSRFHSDERQVPRYRVGRVLLAGDAAHVHSPAGGMGMNTGLQDAANLSWKLSAVLHGRAAAELLDSYHRERHPVGKQALRASGAIIRLALARSPALRALRAVGAELLNRVGPLGRRAVRTVSGIGVSYPSPRGSHPLVGKRAPDLALEPAPGRERLYEALREGKFVLVTPAGDAPGPEAADEERVVHVQSAGGSGGQRTRTLLIRPDGYIAWASDAPDAEGLRRALRQWAGATAPRAA